MLKYLFAADGYGVQFCATAAEALELAHAETFDLYLLDNRLPDRHGIELCRDLRLLHSSAPIVMYSGDAYETQHSAARDAGASAYIDKPHVDHLIATLRDFLSK
jgi:DNA-binding response OmpR family regulator